MCPRTIDSSTDLGLDMDSFITTVDARNRSPRTIEQYREQLSQFQTWLAEEFQVADTLKVRRAHVEKYLIHTRKLGWKPNSQHAAFRSIRAFYNWYQDYQRPRGDWDNPIRGIKGPEVPKERIRPPAPEDAQKIIDTCTGQSIYGSNIFGRTIFDQRDRALLMLILETGIRSNELTNMRFEDVDLTTGNIIIQKGKGNKQRTAFVSPIVCQAMRQYVKRLEEARGKQAPDAYFWWSMRGPHLTSWGVYQMIQRRAEIAGVETPSPHDWRRLFATLKNNEGVTNIDVWRLLGHSNGQTLWRYVDENEDHLREVALKTSPVTKMFGGTSAGRPRKPKPASDEPKPKPASRKTKPAAK